MTKFYGPIGFFETVETKPGIWQEKIVEREYYGEWRKAGKKYQTAGVNDDINIANELSLIVDAYCIENSSNIKYVKFGGGAWKVTAVDLMQYPRLSLTIGGLYNG